MTPDRPLRVGVNLVFLGARAGGVGRYARELPGALLSAEPATEITVFASPELPAEVRTEPWASAVRWVTVPPAYGARGQLVHHLALPALAAARRLDVLHSPANSGPVITPGLASVVSLMDLIWRRYAADWDPDARAQRAMRRSVTHSLRHADRVFAISRAAAAEFTGELGVAAERIVVTPLGVSPPRVTATAERRLRQQLALGDARVILCVAQKRRYKNQELLIRALPSLDADIVLVLPGARTTYEEELRQLAAQLGVTARVRLPDWLSDADLAGLYRLSTVFALPTLAEGFGLPVLEAMQQGLPVACSDIPVLREVAGTAAALFDPGDQGAVDSCLARVLGDRTVRRELVTRGSEQAARFTWARTGETSLRGYREAIAARH